MNTTEIQFTVAIGVYLLFCLALMYVILGRLRKAMAEVNITMQTAKDLVQVNRNKSERLDKLLTKARQRGGH